jgi:hypothetical protein
MPKNDVARGSKSTTIHAGNETTDFRIPSFLQMEQPWPDSSGHLPSLSEPRATSPASAARSHGETQIPERSLFINGAWVEPLQGGRLPVISPATEEQVGSIAAATAADVNLAVAAAQARKDWTTTSGAERAKLLRVIAERVWG